MVVVSGCWMTNNTQNVNYAEMSAAKAVLVSRPNSHPFEQRTLLLDQPVKVGRSVARTRATPTNAIFDCKVLSRHHAIVWHDGGKFYLQDTKSSNGTFVNNNRLSGSNDGEPHELSSGDIVQFGVDVMENNRKVTHGCIVAMVKLYLPDGKEAKASVTTTESAAAAVAAAAAAAAARHQSMLVPLDELYKLHHVIAEASQRELCLETKLQALQHVVEAARRAADDSWQTYVGEERLLSRVATLEMQLMQSAKNVSEERLRDELMQLHDERNVYQLAAKEALMKSHVERLAAVAHASDEERARARAEHEAMLAKEQYDCCQQEMQEIVRKLMNEQKRADEERVAYEAKMRSLQEQIVELQEKSEKGETRSNQEKASGEQEEEDEEEEVVEEEAETEPVQEAKQEDDDIADPLIKYEPLLNDHVNEAERNDMNCKEMTANFYCTESDTDLPGDGGDAQVENKDELITSKEIPLNVLTAADASSLLEVANENDASTMEMDNSTLKHPFDCDELQIDPLRRSLQEAIAENMVLRSELDALREHLVALEAQDDAKDDGCGQEHAEVQTIAGCIHHRSLQVDSMDILDAFHDEDAVYQQQQLGNEISKLEEEVVALKERYAHLNEEKLALSHELVRAQSSFNALNDRRHNAVFVYVAPLVMVVLYLMTCIMFS